MNNIKKLFSNIFKYLIGIPLMLLLISILFCCSIILFGMYTISAILNSIFTLKFEETFYEYATESCLLKREMLHYSQELYNILVKK